MKSLNKTSLKIWKVWLNYIKFMKSLNKTSLKIWKVWIKLV